MRTNYFKKALLLFLLTISCIALQAQVKIGNNPQNINLSSILELESTNKAFVITRVNTVQMNAIIPLEGAMVYNTDSQCLHYYDAVEWINICEAFGNNLTFTSEALANPGNFETITITQNTPTNYNFEVGLLNASNIQDGTIGTSKIVNGSVTLNKLANNSVNSQKISDKSIQTIDIAPGLPNTVLQTNDMGDTVLWAQLDASTITGRDLTQGDNSITITNGIGATLENTNVRVTDGGISTVKLADNAVDNTKLGADAVTTDKILNATVLEEDLADDSVTNIKIANDAVNTAELVDDAVTATKINADIAGTGLIQNITTGALEIDPTTITGDGNITSTDLTVTGGTAAAFNDVTLTITDDAVTATKINADVAGTGLQQNITTGALEIDPTTITGDGDITSTDITITGGTDAAFNDVTLAIANDAVVTGNILNETILSEDIQDGTIANSDILDRTITPIKLADGTAPDQILRFNGTDWQLIDQSSIAIAEADGIIGNEILDVTNGTLTRSGTGIVGDEYTVAVSTDGITANELANDAVTSSKILDDEIVNADINASAAIAGSKINPDFGAQNIVTTGTLGTGNTTITGTLDVTGITTINSGGTNSVTLPGDRGTANQILTTDGLGAATWEDNTSALPTLIDGQILISDGTDLNARSISGDATIANTGALTIENDAVTSLKILDDEIVNADINAAAAIAGSKITPNFVAQNISTTGTFASGNATITGTLNTSGTATIGANTITNVDGTSGQVLTTDGAGNATWTALPVDANTTYSAGTGLSLTGTTFAVDNATIAPVFSNITGIPAGLSDGDDNTTYSAGTGLSLTGTTFAVDNATIAPVFSNITGTPAGLADGDDNTTYTAGTGLSLTGTTFAVDNSTIAPVFTNITGIPAGLADGDDNTTYTAGTGLSLTGTTFAIDNANIANLATTDLTQTTGQDRTYNLNGSDLVFTGTGDIGIGSSVFNPQDKLDVDGQIRARNGFAATAGTVGQPSFGFYTNGDTNTGMFRVAEDQIGFTTGGTEAIRIIANQNVGVGLPVPLSKLHVNGDIRANGSFISGTTTYPDYVFQKYFLGSSSLKEDYEFNTLKKVADFIEKNHHLPGIKSAAEVELEGGWNITEGALNNLEKIEELFLHTINQEKQIEKLKSENKSLSEELKNLRAEVETIKAMISAKND